MRPPSRDAHWRDSARYPRFFIVDARASFPILLALIHITVWTISLALVAMVFFAILNRYGFTVAVFGRWARSFLAGRRKISAPWWMN